MLFYFNFDLQFDHSCHLCLLLCVAYLGLSCFFFPFDLSSNFLIIFSYFMCCVVCVMCYGMCVCVHVCGVWRRI